jgi:hypothetical protein
MADRVVDDVCEHLRQKFAIAERSDVWGNRRHESLSRILCRWRKGLGNDDEYFAEIHGSERCAPIAGLNTKRPVT